jgi:CO/xanthine dehydrogenase Mo-binding subunit
MATPLVTPAIGNAIAQLTAARLRHSRRSASRKHWRNIQATRAPQDARETRVLPEWGGLQHPSHRENRGSSPLGSANDFQ